MSAAKGDPERAVNGFIAVADLLDEPRLARLYTHVLQGDDVTIDEIVADLDIPRTTAYSDAYTYADPDGYAHFDANSHTDIDANPHRYADDRTRTIGALGNLRRRSSAGDSDPCDRRRHPRSRIRERRDRHDPFHRCRYPRDEHR